MRLLLNIVVAHLSFQVVGAYAPFQKHQARSHQTNRPSLLSSHVKKDSDTIIVGQSENADDWISRDLNNQKLGALDDSHVKKDYDTIIVNLKKNNQKL